MGSGLFDEFPELTERASEVLGYSVRKLCLENPNRLLDETQYTQPAMFFVNALQYERRLRGGAAPASYAIGHSLGEYNALHAAGVFDLETGLRLVKERGAAMGRIEGGAMAAVVGLGRVQVAALLDDSGLAVDIDVANDNAPTQVVISGPRPAILSARAVFEAVPDTTGFTVLKTSGAFHSRYMASAQSRFAAYLDDSRFAFAEPTVPVIANVDAQPYRRSEVASRLVQQITQPVRWSETIGRLSKAGEHEFVEVGTGRVLTTLLDRIRQTVPSR